MTSERVSNYRDELELLFNTLLDDVVYAAELLVKNDNQTNRRIYIRAIYALLEGEIYERKQMALAIIDSLQHDILRDEIPLLTEIDMSIDDDGTPRARERHLPLAQNILYSLKIIARAFSIDPRIDKSNGWDALLKAIKIRHRITHPKSSTNLTIQDSEMKIVDQAFEWYRRTWGNIMDQMPKNK